MQVGEVMFCAGLSWLSWFGNKGEGEILERPNDGLKICP